MSFLGTEVRNGGAEEFIGFFGNFGMVVADEKRWNR